MIYLDNAATTFPKPHKVYREVQNCITRYCGNPGRGSHALSRASAQVIYRCREALAEFFHSEAPENVVFTLNTTYALNLAIKGLVRYGDHVLISDMEHNSVLRPLHTLAARGDITYSVFPTLTMEEHRTPEDICREIEACITEKTRLLVCAHASNICSSALPLAEIGDVCHRHGMLFVVDGAQSAGILPIDMQRMHIDALCLPGHKGLYGIQGTGILLFGNCLPSPLIEGGNGVQSLEPTMPDFSPERYESGTLPTPAIAGLYEGVRFVADKTTDAIRAHEEALFLRLRENLGNLPGITLHAAHHVGSTLLFSMDKMPSEKLARLLDEEYGICTRAGFHCSALGHKTLGTPADGAVRISFGCFNHMSDVEALTLALSELSRRVN